MRTIIIAIFCLSLSNYSIAQNTYKGQPLLLAEKENADIAIGREWYEGSWRISPKIEHDTFSLMVYSSKEDFAFRTDKDSIKFTIKPGETKSFYVKLGTAEPAHTVITAHFFNPEKIMFGNKPERKDVKLFYERASNSYYAVTTFWRIASIMFPLVMCPVENR